MSQVDVGKKAGTNHPGPMDQSMECGFHHK